MKDHLVDIVKYNFWANSRIVDILRTHDEVLIKQEMVNSFPSIQKTFYHNWDAQVIWLHRISRNIITGLPSFNLEEPIEKGYQGMLENCKEWITYVKSQTEEQLISICKYYTTKGEEKEKPVYQIIHHCMNHSTYHRGQIITLGKQAGFENLVSTDFMFYKM